jgi:hypothetical protein
MRFSCATVSPALATTTTVGCGTQATLLGMGMADGRRSIYCVDQNALWQIPLESGQRRQMVCAGVDEYQIDREGKSVIAWQSGRLSHKYELRVLSADRYADVVKPLRGVGNLLRVAVSPDGSQAVLVVDTSTGDGRASEQRRTKGLP